jgi:O-antigen ligase
VKRGEHLVFGVGPRNFSSIDINAIELPEPLKNQGFKLSHAHHLYLNRLVEEGVVGLGAFIFFLTLVATALYRDWRAGDWRTGWIAPSRVAVCIAGLFNGAFNEHAIWRWR